MTTLAEHTERVAISLDKFRDIGAKYGWIFKPRQNNPFVIDGFVRGILLFTAEAGVPFSYPESATIDQIQQAFKVAEIEAERFLSSRPIK